MEDSADDERAVELASIAAIYPELVVDNDDPYSATLALEVTPIQPLRILFTPTADGIPPNPDLPAPPVHRPLALDEHELSHLPPLTLHITLPDDYPSNKPPIVSISVTPQWLAASVIEQLKDDCAKLWEDFGRDQVVYAYIDHVQQQADQAFGLAGQANVSMSNDIQLALLDFDLKTKREHFERETFDCGICLEPKKGLSCHKLLQCGHVFCVACLQDFYKSCITEGDVDNVKCINPTCGKDEPTPMGPDGRPLKRRKQDRTLAPSELLQIPIERELVQRYVFLKRKKRLEADQSTVYCPRQWCQGAAKSKKHPKPIGPMDDLQDSYDESDDEDKEQPSSEEKRDNKHLEALPMAERLAICEDCNFAFCCVCTKSWHGENAVCRPKQAKQLTEEEAASEEYLKKYSTPCPTCSAPAQKTMGCNHMICFKCKTHFCYLCSTFLMPDNPYRHFNDHWSPCYQRLWELEEGDGEGVAHNAELRLWREEELLDAEEGLQPDNLPIQAQPPVRRRFDDEEDTDDEEPAPDQRRNRNVIEIVNFARDGEAQRIELPERPRLPPEAEVAVRPQPHDPPVLRRRRRRRGGGNQQGVGPNGAGRNHQPQHQARAHAAPAAAAAPRLGILV